MKELDSLLVPGKRVTVKFTDLNPENCRTSDVVFVSHTGGTYDFVEQAEKSEGARYYKIQEGDIQISDKGFTLPPLKYRTFPVYEPTELEPLKKMLIEAGLWIDKEGNRKINTTLDYIQDNLPEEDLGAQLKRAIETDDFEKAIYLKNKLKK